MTDPFVTFPAPLPLMIVEAIEDLPTLNYLLQASPTVAAMFDRDYERILRAVVSYYPTTVQNLLRILLRLHLQQEVDKSEETDYKEYAEKVRQESMDDPDKVIATLTAAKRLTRLSSHIQQLANDYLINRLTWVNKIEPSRLLDPTYDYRSMYPKEPPACEVYQPVTCGPPSWIEEQRVLRALWRIQAQFEAIVWGTTRVDSGSLFTLLSGVDPFDFWDEELEQWEHQETIRIYEYLVKKKLIQDPYLGESTQFISLPSVASLPVADPVPYPRHDDVLRAWHQSEEYLDRQSPGNAAMRDLKECNDSPIRKESFYPLGDLGFPIWDAKRMASLGLITIPETTLEKEKTRTDRQKLSQVMTQDGLSWNDGITRWKSVLDKALKDDLENEDDLVIYYEGF